MGLAQVNTSSHLGQSYHVGRHINTSARALQFSKDHVTVLSLPAKMGMWQKNKTTLRPRSKNNTVLTIQN